MFKFKGISSEDMQVVIEEEEHFISRASQRYEMTEIEGRDGAIFDELGYSVVERPIYVQCLNINKIDDILAWLNGEGEFEYKGRKTTARFYSQLEPQRSSCIRIIDTTFIRDPFWCKVNEDYQLVKDRKDKKASGEYIHVEDSSNCRSIIGISGNSEQETRSGKNLLLNDTDKGTVNGITFTKDSKGIIKANGTATDAIVVYLGSKFTTIAAGTYKLSDGRNDESKDTFFTYVDCYNTDGSAYATGNLISTSDGSVKTYTESKLIKGRIVVRKGVTLNNIVFKPQLELIKNASDSATEYEQYGASPSPDYPSKVQPVGDNVNEFDINTVKNAILNEKTGEIILNNDWRCSDFIEVLNKTYAFGWESSSSYFQVKICYYDENKKFLLGKSYNLNNTFNITFEVVSNAKYMKIAYSVLVSR